jgi:uncharacterized protein (TIGR03435 family)
LTKPGLRVEVDFAFEAAREDGETNPSIALFAPVIGELGLRLESRRGPVEIYVVEAAERPSEN